MEIRGEQRAEHAQRGGRVLIRDAATVAPRFLLGAEARAFLHALPLHEPGFALPEAVHDQLDELGIQTAGALAALPRAGVALRFDAAVLAPWELLTGAAEPVRRVSVLPLPNAAHNSSHIFLWSTSEPTSPTARETRHGVDIPRISVTDRNTHSRIRCLPPSWPPSSL
jgi:hypothetical protein